MPFTDELSIRARAGNGGNGVVRWLHPKGKEFGGPAGGDGGRGGSIYAHAVRDVYLLAKYKNKKEFVGETGHDGGKKSLHGLAGKDLELALPVGSIITNETTGEKVSLSEVGERVLLLKGGFGGRGNESFKSSTNRSPREWTAGKPGQSAELFIEVELIADIGFIGLPNAGKSSLLNAMTNANAKIGSYPFTTLEPNLGEVFGYILSDIPGLIEGAASGKGLGHKFLKHVRRTKVLVHLISLENEDLSGAYRTVRAELEAFDPALKEKGEFVVLTKTDLVDDEKDLRKRVKALEKVVPVADTVTVYDDIQVKALRDMLIREVDSRQPEKPSV